jgi:hypothetical protein
MITPSHMIYSWAIAKATKKVPDKRRTLAFVAGGVVPDLPTYAFFFVNTFLLGTSQQLMWDMLYFDSVWSPFITLSHSLILWPIILLFAAILKKNLLKYFAVSALLHVAIDFFVHHDDAYRHFWPLTDWKFFSPVSYYDPQYFGYWVNMSDSILVVALLGWLGTIYTKNTKLQYVIGSLIVLYVVMNAASLYFV